MKRTDCTREISGRSFSNPISMMRLTLRTRNWVRCVSCNSSKVLTSHLIPRAAALGWDVRHKEARSSAWKSQLGHFHESSMFKRGGRPHLTRPMPAIRLAHELESGCRKPANDRSSKNGESASRSREILSRATVRRRYVSHLANSSITRLTQ